LFVLYVSLCVGFPVFINGVWVKFMLFSLVIIGWSNIFVFSNYLNGSLGKIFIVVYCFWLFGGYELLLWTRIIYPIILES
jgi:hypothetical protein